MSTGVLDTSVEYLKGVGPARADLLKKELNLFTFGDLLTYFPFRYVDRSRFHKISELHGELPYVQLVGKIRHVDTIGGQRAKRLVAQFYDGTGVVELVWFKGIRWIKPGLNLEKEYVVFGKPNVFKGKVSLPHPEMNLLSEYKNGGGSPLQAVYSSGEKLTAKGLNSRGIEKVQRHLIQKVKGKIPENLPGYLLKKMNMIGREQAFMNIHFPQSREMLQKAQFRLKFEELFFIQLDLLKLKLIRNEKFKGFLFGEVGTYFNAFYRENLPFELTGAQKRVIKEIRKDMGSGKQMNRLLQGDVGSGKTVVAFMVALIALDNGFQSCLMAPTEILANQHMETITELAKGLGLNIGLLTGATKTAERKVLHEQLETGELDIIIGTHALLEDKVKFNNLGLVIVDEQHRFGVAQRAKLWKKNVHPPHVLVMTATPIPRTLAMTFYGDLDVSVIDELPPGRKPVKTVHKSDSGRLRVFGFMKQQIDLGRQVYVVYPLIQESEKMDYKDLMDGYESICRSFPQPRYQVSIVHGQMKTEAKDYEMQRFVEGKTQILVATTVIEVGVNVPNASVMVIESAERFGLSQLHQLRGRVGRGADQSYCVLMTGKKLSNDARQRIRTMVKTNDGFEIAEADMKLRGPGDLMGTQQSGILNLRLADLIQDGDVLELARKAAIAVLQKDPELQLPENKEIAQYYRKTRESKPNWSRIS